MARKRKPRVVLADDEAVSRKLMHTVMSSMNCDVVGQAINGEEAMEIFKKERPDILFLDIHMPRKTGEEALREIMAASPDALVIMLTAVSDVENVANCLDMGAANYILKGTSVTEIKKIIGDTWRSYRHGHNAG